MGVEERDPAEGAPAAEAAAPADVPDQSPAADVPAGPPAAAATATEAREAPEEGGSGEPGRAGPPERRRRHFGRRKVCGFCVEHVRAIDYKDAGKLRRYLSDRGRIEARRKTGTCAKHQRWLATALKRARHLALMPYTPEHIRTSGITTGRR